MAKARKTDADKQHVMHYQHADDKRKNIPTAVIAGQGSVPKAEKKRARVPSGRKLRDVLSHLNYTDVKKLLGPSCDRLLREGGLFEIDLESHVSLDNSPAPLPAARCVTE